VTDLALVNKLLERARSLREGTFESGRVQLPHTVALPYADRCTSRAEALLRNS
jgi:hypothetical protein